MTRRLSVLAAVGALLASPAFAADMPTKAAPASAQPALYGLYVGVHGGAGWANQQYDFVTIPGVVTGDIHPAGVMGGATLGFGGAIGAAWAGVEADFDYDFTRASSGCGDAGNCTVKNGWFMTQGLVFGVPLPAIMGVLPQSGAIKPNQWPIPLAAPTNISAASIMPAIKAGLAERNVSACATPIGAGNTVCDQRWMLGPFVGAQLRSAISQNWTAKIEYDYVFFNKSWTSPDATVLGPAKFRSLNEQRTVIGLDYHL